MNAMTTTPTPAPDKCPACLSTGQAETFYGSPAVIFNCGKLIFLKDDGHGWRPHFDYPCREAEAAALALRAERDAALALLIAIGWTEKDGKWRRIDIGPIPAIDQVFQLENERDALTAQLAEARAELECGHPQHLFIQSSLFGWTRDEDELRVEDSGCLMCYSIELEKEQDTLTASLARVTKIMLPFCFAIATNGQSGKQYLRCRSCDGTTLDGDLEQDNVQHAIDCKLTAALAAPVDFKPLELSEKDKEFIRVREEMEKQIALGWVGQPLAAPVDAPKNGDEK